MFEYEEIGCFYISKNQEISISLYGCVVFTILNVLENANLLFICLIQANSYIIISTIVLILVSVISIIIVWISYYNYKTENLWTFIGIIFVAQIIATIINKVFIANYSLIKQIYIYAIYSYEFLAMFIIYILIESTIDDTLINITVMYIFILASMPALQKHDQNNQDEQYFAMLSFLMLLPTLVVIAAPSIHIFYTANN